MPDYDEDAVVEAQRRIQPSIDALGVRVQALEGGGTVGADVTEIIHVLSGGSKYTYRLTSAPPVEPPPVLPPPSSSIENEQPWNDPDPAHAAPIEALSAPLPDWAAERLASLGVSALPVE